VILSIPLSPISILASLLYFAIYLLHGRVILFLGSCYRILPPTFLCYGAFALYLSPSSFASSSLPGIVHSTGTFYIYYFIYILDLGLPVAAEHVYTVFLLF